MDGQAVATAALNIIVVAAEARSRTTLLRVLESGGLGGAAAFSLQDALSELKGAHYDVALLDMHEVGWSGLRELAGARPRYSRLRLVVILDHDQLPLVPDVRKLGVAGILVKPFEADELLDLLDQRGTRRAPRQKRVQHTGGLPVVRGYLVGRSPAMEQMFELMERVAPTRATVLVTGETGTGKELVARALHDLSGRAHEAFVPVNCSALPETLLESELFGHTKGSFTGAIGDRRGLFEDADGGTLFLDEISTLTPAVQVKLLRVLQDRRIQRIGARGLVSTDFRLLAASNVNLEDEVRAGRFRADLYYRLNVFPIEVPPLRERAGDIPLLVSHFRRKYQDEFGVQPATIEPETLARLNSYSWPGNVRELENFMQRAMILHGGGHICFQLPASASATVARTLHGQASAEQWPLSQLEREYILHVLESCNGQRSRAALVLGIDRRTLYRKLKEYDVSDA